MPARIINPVTAQHYTWGGPENTSADAWYLLRSDDLHILQELIPPGIAETRHRHQRARQFFFVLAGELSIEIEHHHFLLRPGDGIEVSPGQEHQAANRALTPLSLLVTSQPPSHGDRIETP